MAGPLSVSALATLAFVIHSILCVRIRIHPKIVGGRNTKINDHPYQVSVHYQNTHICGGSIIGTNKILTAAHCTHRLSNSSFRIRYCSNGKNFGGKIIHVDKIYQHPDFDQVTADYDVSVLILRRPILLSDCAQIIDLESAEAPEGDRTAVVTGWGQLRTGGGFPNQLQAVTVREVSRDVCKKAYLHNNVTERMICFADEDKDACQGDSGGALVADGKQIGIVSWGLICADPRSPGVYSNVAQLRNFIDPL